MIQISGNSTLFWLNTEKSIKKSPVTAVEYSLTPIFGLKQTFKIAPTESSSICIFLETCLVYFPIKSLKKASELLRILRN